MVQRYTLSPGSVLSLQPIQLMSKAWCDKFFLLSSIMFDRKVKRMKRRERRERRWRRELRDPNLQKPELDDMSFERKKSDHVSSTLKFEYEYRFRFSMSGTVCRGCTNSDLIRT